MIERDDDFTTFVVARSPSLLRLAYLLTGNRNDAEDLVQVALTNAYVSWKRIESAHAVDSYVRTCLVRSHFAGRRRSSVPVSTLVVDPVDRRSAAALESVEDRDELWDALLNLPPRQRAVLVLKYLEDLDEATIAALLRCSRGTVKSQTSARSSTLRVFPDAVSGRS